MEFNCFIIDDEPLAISLIESHLKRLPQFKVAGRFTNALDAFVELKSEPIDLLFLDIEMPEFNGLDFLKSVKDRPEVIITTAYREYAVDGFEHNCLDYLVKPISFERFVQSIDKFLSKKTTSTKVEAPKQKFIVVRADRKDVKIMLDDIIYIEGLKDYVKIILPNKTILTKESIGNFGKLLPNNKFIRSHKSYIVSLDKITAISSNDIQLGDIGLPVGRTYKNRVTHLYK